MATTQHNVKTQLEILAGNVFLAVSAFAVDAESGGRCMGDGNRRYTSHHFAGFFKFLQDRQVLLSVGAYVEGSVWNPEAAAP